MEEPLVSICCICYNQERYIKNALESFVTQQTNFPYEIVISDDCSKDLTRSIIAEYKQRYPKLFRDVSPEKNLGAFANFTYVQKQAKGKYIAICEGDDYWTDPLKLQKQVDFLESNLDYSMCCHGADVLNETSLKVECDCETMSTREYFPDDAFPNWQIPTASIVYRRELVQTYKIVRLEDFKALDVVLILQCMSVGRVWGWAEHMSVYRVNPGGLTRQKEDFIGQLKQCKHYEALEKNFPKINRDYCNRYIAMIYYTKSRQDKQIGQKVISLLKAFYRKPSYVIGKIFKVTPKPRTDLFYRHYHI